MRQPLHHDRHALGRRLPRRALLGAGATAALGLNAGWLSACSGGGRRPGNTSGGSATPAAALTAAPGVPTPAPNANAEAQGRPGGVLTLAAPGYPPGYDLVAQDAALTGSFIGLVCNGLLAFRNGSARFPDAADTAVAPDLAAAPEQPDARTYLFKLRPGITWQRVAPLNGRALSAADIVWHFTRAAHDPKSTLKPDFGVIDRVEAVDEATVKFTLKEPSAPFLTLVAGGLSRYVLPCELGEAGTPRNTLVGTGPFLLAPHTPGATAVFKRNPDYWKRDAAGKPLPYADEVRWLALGDAAARLQRLQAREANLSWTLAPDELAQLRAGNSNDYEFADLPGVSNYLYMRLDQPPFNDRRVRQALSLALDRPALVQALGKGRGQTDLPIPAFLREYALPPDKLGEAGKLYTRDLQAAKQLLAAAGHADGLNTTLTYTAQYGAAFVQAARLLTAQLKEAGVAVAPNQVEYPAYLGGAFVGKFEGLAYGQRRRFPDPDPYLSYYYLPRALFDQDHADDADLRALIAKQRQTLDRNARLAALGEIQRYLSDAMYRVYDVAIADAHAWARTVKNWRGNAWQSFSPLEAVWLRP